MEFIKCKLTMDQDDEIVTSVFVNSSKVLVKTLDDLREYLKYGSTIKMILQVSCLWSLFKNITA